MSDRLLVSTRKGFFLIDTRDWRIDHAAFLGDICNLAFRDPRDGAIYLAQALGHFGAKLHRSSDNGRSWKEVATPAYAKAGDGEEAPSVSHVFSLESDLGAKAGGLWCGTIPGGLFHSADGGESWQLNQGLWNHPGRKEWVGGGLDNPGMGSVEVDPRDRNHLTVGVSTGGVWQTSDGGKSWRNTTKGLYAEFLPPERRHDPILQDIHRVVLCPTAPDRLWLQHHNGVFRSDDGGETWHDITTIRPAKFGFAVQVHPKDPDTAWFVPGIKDEARIPVGGKVVVSRTKDGGKSFEVFDKGLPGPHAYDIVLRHALAVDGDGRRLAMGSTTGHLWASEDAGQSWRLIAGHLPPIAAVRFG